jgi:hypothetical protein
LFHQAHVENVLDTDSVRLRGDGPPLHIVGNLPCSGRKRKIAGEISDGTRHAAAPTARYGVPSAGPN